MIAVAKLETLRAVALALDRLEAWDEPWCEGPEVEEPLALGERLGWLFRLSATQVHWSEAGVAAFREFRPQTPLWSRRVTGDLSIRAQHLLLAGGDALTDLFRKNASVESQAWRQENP